MDLFLISVDADSGRPHFGPNLAFTLALAELLDQIRAGRGAPRDQDAVHGWIAGRGPHCIEAYLAAAHRSGCLKVAARRADGAPARKRIQVADRRQLDDASGRLIRVLGAPHSPTEEDLTFLVLASEIGRAQAHLRGFKHREHRRRLDELVKWVTEYDKRQSALQTALRQGLEAVRALAARMPFTPSSDAGRLTGDAP